MALSYLVQFKTRVPDSIASIQACAELLTSAVRLCKILKCIISGKAKMSLIADDIIVYIENANNLQVYN